jgi:integrase
MMPDDNNELPLDVEAHLEEAEAEAKQKAMLKRGLASLRGTRRSVYMRRSILRMLSKSPEEIAAYSRAMFEVGYNFGWRVSELLSMHVRQIDLASRAIRLEVGETKNDEGREVEMTPLVYALVQQCVAGKQGGDFVFTRESGKPVRDFRGAWEKVCTAAGVPELLFHDLRRTAVRNMVRRGIPERVAMTISGHKTRSIFDRYNIVSKTDLHEAAKKLALRDQEREEAQSNQNSYSYSSDIVEPSGGSVAPTAKLN